VTDPAALAIPQGLPPGDAYWIHEDPNGISPAAARGVTRALRKDWSSGPLDVRVAEFRASLVYRSWLAAKIIGASGMSAERGALGMSPDWSGANEYASTNERARLVAAIGKTGLLLRRPMPDRGFDLKTFTTSAGGETAALPLVAIAVVTVIVAVAESAAIAYLAHEAKFVVDNYLARSATLQDLAQTDAQTLKIIDHHVAREDEQGHPIPLDDSERAALGLLEKRQVEAMKKLNAPAPVKDSELPWWVLPASIAAAAATAFVFAKI